MSSQKSKKTVVVSVNKAAEAARLREDLMRIRRDAISVVRQVEAILGLPETKEKAKPVDNEKEKV